jgi:hypothetical protein
MIVMAEFSANSLPPPTRRFRLMEGTIVVAELPDNPPPPRPDARGFFRRFSAWLDAKPIEVISAAIAFFGTVAALSGIYLVWWQLLDLRETLTSTAHSYIYSELLELDKTLLDAGLYPYFEGGKNLNPLDPKESDKDRDRVRSYAEMKLDIIETFLSQKQHLEDPDWEAWAAYFVYSFEKGPVLCATVSEKPDEFDKGVVAIAKIACANPAQPQSAPDHHRNAVTEVVKVINPAKK